MHPHLFTSPRFSKILKEMVMGTMRVMDVTTLVKFGFKKNLPSKKIFVSFA